MMFVKLRDWSKTSPAEFGGSTLVRLSPPGRFADQLDLERNRADRSGQSFALVIFRFSGAHDPERFRLAGRIEQRLRAVDHAGWLDEERIGVILTNTREPGARTFAANLVQTGGEPVVCRYEVYVYPGGGPAGEPRSDRRATGSERMSGTTTGVLGAVEQRVTNAVNFMQDLCDAAASGVHTGAHGEHRPGAIKAAPEPANAPCDCSDLPAGEAVVPSLEPLFARPLPRWKRALDIIGVVVAGILFAPVMLIAAVLVKLTSRGPVLFRQSRAGLGGRRFTIYKFRTMSVGADARQAELRQYSEQDGPAFKLRNDPRLTPIGGFLRRSCIDELPQLWNVLKGDMTLVGPRPLDAAEADQITGWQRRRIDATPGLTCIWQVHGKSRVPFVEWMRMDIRYLKSRTLLQDLKLIAQTVLAVVLQRGSG